MCRKTQIAMHNIKKKLKCLLNIRFSDLSYQSQNSKMSYIYKEIYSIVLTFNQQLLVKDEVRGGPLKRPLNTDDEGLKLTYDYTTLF